MTSEVKEVESKEAEAVDPPTPKIPMPSADSKKVKSARRKSLQCTTVRASPEDLALASPVKDYSSCSSADVSSDDTEPSTIKSSKQPSKSRSSLTRSTPERKKHSSDDSKPQKQSSSSVKESSSEATEVPEGGEKHSSSGSKSRSDPHHGGSSSHRHGSSSSRHTPSMLSIEEPLTPRSRHEKTSSMDDEQVQQNKRLTALSGDEADMQSIEVRERTASGGERKHRRHGSSSRSKLSRTPEKPLKVGSEESEARGASDERASTHSSHSSNHSHGSHTPSSKVLNPDYSKVVSSETGNAAVTKSDGDVSSVDSDSTMKPSPSTDSVVDEALEDAQIVDGDDDGKSAAAKQYKEQLNNGRVLPSTLTTPMKKRFTALLTRNASFVAGEITPPVYMRQRPMAQLFIVKQGNMFKKSLKTGRWKKRYVVMTPEQLHCFKDAADSGDAEISINLQYAVVRPRQTHDLKPAFDVVTTDGVLSLMGSDNTMTQEWFTSISQSIEHLVEESAKNNSNAADQKHGTDDGTGSNSGNSDKNKAALMELLQRPENHLCADCSRPDPQWASTNLGSFVCITCSGIHRGLGVHITKIRSVSMDTWTDEQVAVMASKGNKKVNDYYLATLPEGVKVPTPETPVEELKQFLHEKYVLQKYVPEEDKGKAQYANRAPPMQISLASISSDEIFQRSKNGGSGSTNVPPGSGRKSLTLDQHLMLMTAVRDDVVFRAELQRFIFQTDDGAVFKKTLLTAIEKDEDFKEKLKQALLN